MKPHKKYKTMIIEPSEIVREGIKIFLERSNNFQVTACFSDLQSFETQLLKDDFQIILFNPSLIGFCKVFDVKELFSSHPSALFVAILYQYVDAKILKNFDGTLGIYDEGWLIPQKIIKTIETIQPKDKQTTKNIKLSEREKDVLIFLAKGLTNKEIADKLYISTHTVISHRKNIVQKTGIKTISGLTLYALFNNLISQEELL